MKVYLFIFLLTQTLLATGLAKASGTTEGLSFLAATVAKKGEVVVLDRKFLKIVKRAVPNKGGASAAPMHVVGGGRRGWERKTQGLRSVSSITAVFRANLGHSFSLEKGIVGESPFLGEGVTEASLVSSAHNRYIINY